MDGPIIGRRSPSQSPAAAPLTLPSRFGRLQEACEGGCSGRRQPSRPGTRAGRKGLAAIARPAQTRAFPTSLPLLSRGNIAQTRRRPSSAGFDCPRGGPGGGAAVQRCSRRRRAEAEGGWSSQDQNRNRRTGTRARGVWRSWPDSLTGVLEMDSAGLHSFAQF